MIEKNAPIGAIVLFGLAVALALALIFGVYYWLLGVVGCPDDWRGTIALALTAAGNAGTRFSRSKEV